MLHMVVTLLVFQLEMFPLNASAELNIPSIFSTLLVSRFVRFWLKFLVKANMYSIFFTLLVFQLSIGWLKCSAQANIYPIYWTFLISHLEILLLNFIAWWNILIVDVILFVFWFNGKIIWLLSFSNNLSAMSGSKIPSLNSILLISRRVSCNLFAIKNRLSLSICAPAQVGCIVSSWFSLFHTPFTFVPRSKVWLGMETWAKAKPIETRIRKNEKISFEYIFIFI